MQVSVAVGPARVYGVGALVWWVVGRLLRAVVSRAVSRPRTTCAVFGVIFTCWAYMAHPAATLAVVWLPLEVVHWWALLGPWSWRRRGRPWLLARWRSAWVYRRRWRLAMLVCELDREDPDGVRRLPSLGRVSCTDRADLVRVRGLPGQRFSQWEEAAPMLAHLFGATAVEVRRGDARRLTLELERGRVGRSWDRDE